MTVLADPTGRLMKDNGVSLHRVRYPDEISGEFELEFAMTVNTLINFPVLDPNTCTHFDVFSPSLGPGKAVEVTVIVDNVTVRRKKFCVRDAIVGQDSYNHTLNVPLPVGVSGGTPVVAIFERPGTKDSQFPNESVPDSGAPSAVSFTTEYISSAPPGNGNGNGSGGGNGGGGNGGSGGSNGSNGGSGGQDGSNGTRDGSGAGTLALAAAGGAALYLATRGDDS